MSFLQTALVSTCLFVGQAVSAFRVGVGFCLAIDYGVASVHFSNGTTVNVAKIQGPEAYKLAMKAAVSIPDYAQVNFTITNDAGGPGVPSSHDNDNPFANSVPTTQTSLLTRSLRDHLPPWLGGKKPSLASQALHNMLRLLTQATESYLSSEIPSLSLSIPYPISDRAQKEIRTALSTLLKTDMTRLHQAPQIATLAQHVPDPAEDCEYSEDGLILGLDFSRAAFTATLGFEDCGVWETERILHSTALEAERVFRGEAEEADKLREKLMEAMRRVTELPVEVYGGQWFEPVSRVVLLGDQVLDLRFQELVREVLRESFSGGAEALSAQFQNGELGPVYIAAVGGAIWAQGLW